MDENVLKEHYNVIFTAWRFLKDRMQNFEDTDRYWEVTMEIANEIYKPYEKTACDLFARKIIVEMVRELSRIAREKHEEIAASA